MRGVAMLVACCACDGAFGLHPTVGADAGAFAGSACDPLAPFDVERYRGLVVGSSSGFSAATALEACQARGLELVSFDAGDTSELANETSGAPSAYWTGLHYTAAGWANPDGCLPPDLWRAGQPSPNDTSQCGLMTNNNLVAASCSADNYGTVGPINALCETPRPSPACYAQWPQRTYRVPDQGGYTYVQAAPKCNQPNEHVVVIDTSAELAAVNQVAAMNGLTAYWLGATFTGTTWLSATSCPAIYTWGPGEPNLSGGGTCVQVQSGSMFAHACSSTGEVAQVICETNN